MSVLGATGVLLSLLHWRRIGLQHLLFVACVVGWSATILLLQRRHPYPRVALFVIPVYFMVASAGWRALCQWSPKVSARLHQSAPLLAVGVGSIVCGQTWLTRSMDRIPILAQEASGFREAPAVASALNTAAGVGDAFIAEAPAYLPVQYYARGKALSAFTRDLRVATRALVLIPDGSRHPDPVALARATAKRPACERALLVQRFDRGTLYSVELRGPGRGEGRRDASCGKGRGWATPARRPGVAARPAPAVGAV